MALLRMATWNVNSIRAREERLVAWLAAHAPDVLCLQELKVTDDAFPHDAIRGAGYHAVTHGQKTYNGVAILAKQAPTDVVVGLADGVDDPQARLVAARVRGVRVISAYVPNGGEVGSDKWTYKLAWLARLRQYLDTRCSPAEPLALCGDLNIAPDDLDVKNPQAWKDTVLCRPEVRACFESLVGWGLEDAFRKHHPEGGVYTWWTIASSGSRRTTGCASTTCSPPRRSRRDPARRRSTDKSARARARATTRPSSSTSTSERDERP